MSIGVWISRKKSMLEVNIYITLDTKMVFRAVKVSGEVTEGIMVDREKGRSKGLSLGQS